VHVGPVQQHPHVTRSPTYLPSSHSDRRSRSHSHSRNDSVASISPSPSLPFPILTMCRSHFRLPAPFLRCHNHVPLPPWEITDSPIAVVRPSPPPVATRPNSWAFPFPLYPPLCLFPVPSSPPTTAKVPQRPSAHGLFLQFLLSSSHLPLQARPSFCATRSCRCWLLAATAGPHIQTSAATTNIATISVMDNDDGVAPSADALSSAQCFMHARSGGPSDGDGTRGTRLYAGPCAHSMTTRTGRGALT
jgi:hypothetical protein